VVVVTGADGMPFVLLDGFKRVRALARLRIDIVSATVWDLAEPDALIVERLLRTSGKDTPLEQGWLLQSLKDRFGFTSEQLATRFDKSLSWVSGRLGLVADLPESIQEQVRTGEFSAHAAMRHLLPLARAHGEDAARLARAIGPLRPSCRQTEALVAAYVSGSDEARALVLSDPGIVLRAREVTRRPESLPRTPAALLCDDLRALVEITRRARRRVRTHLAAALTPPERLDVARALAEARAEIEPFLLHTEKEILHARPEEACRDPGAP
jgi:ParB-like chromosome segregation protein Spo0J